MPLRRATPAPLAAALLAALLAATATAQLTLNLKVTVHPAPGLTYTRTAENRLSFTLTGRYPPSGTALYPHVLDIQASEEAYILLHGDATLILDGAEHPPGSKIRLTPGTHTAGFKLTGTPGQPYTAKAELELLPPALALLPDTTTLAIAAAAATALLAAAALHGETGARRISRPLAALYLLLKTPDQALQHRARRDIVELLRRRPGLTARRIARAMHMSLGEAQWHLSVLERVGTVKSIPISKWRAYFLTGTPPAVWLHGFLREQGCDVPLQLVEENLPLLAQLIRSRAKFSQIRRLLGC